MSTTGAETAIKLHLTPSDTLEVVSEKLDKAIEEAKNESGSGFDKTAGALKAIPGLLLKAAVFGADANWGRILCAIGYAPADLDISLVSVDFSSAAGTVAVCRKGSGVPFDEQKARAILLEKEIVIDINLHDGLESATAWGCDLTYDYVKINGDYRT